MSAQGIARLRGPRAPGAARTDAEELEAKEGHARDEAAVALTAWVRAEEALEAEATEALFMSNLTFPPPS